MLVTALFVVRTRDLLAATMLLGAYSLLSAGMFMVLDAVDVAFTEAAVGAGVSTILMLYALVASGRFERTPTRPQWLPLLVVLATGAALVWGTFDLPPVGAPGNPVHQHVAPRYLQQSGAEIGIPNVVTSVLASYRGYDTLGETAVVFTAGLGVWLLIGGLQRRGAAAPVLASAPHANLILRVVSKFLIPVILLFGLYVQFHGELGPGGGFQAGVILASALIVHLQVFGADQTRQIVPESLLRVLAPLGVLLYGGTGVAGLLLGGNYLDYHPLGRTPVGGQHLGILLVELGVALTVSSTMLLLCYLFAARVARR
ncbi:MAG: hypothetical protein AMXMBFR25_01500 [Lysobacterales bacterium]|nr:hypothetical protein [Xanthomonadales bacterium]